MGLKGRSTMREKEIYRLREIEKICKIILEDIQLRENRLLAARVGLENILTICGQAMEEIQKDPDEKK